MIIKGDLLKNYSIKWEGQAIVEIDLPNMDDILMEHYKQGKADAIAEKEGKLMQTFSPD
jgi:hypothetical protein